MNRVLIMVMLAGLMAACAPTMPPFTGDKGLVANPYVIDIYWSKTDTCKVDKVVEDTKATCVDAKPGFCVGRGKSILWRSNDPSNAKYQIFFDPIKGAPLKAGGNGIIKKPIDQYAPIANYKYSIVRDGCKANEENTFDPHIRVDR